MVRESYGPFLEYIAERLSAFPDFCGCRRRQVESAGRIGRQMRGRFLDVKICKIIKKYAKICKMEICGRRCWTGDFYGEYMFSGTNVHIMEGRDGKSGKGEKEEKMAEESEGVEKRKRRFSSKNKK